MNRFGYEYRPTKTGSLELHSAAEVSGEVMWRIMPGGTTAHDGDPITAPLGSVAVAAMIRWNVLRYIATFGGLFPSQLAAAMVIVHRFYADRHYIMGSIYGNQTNFVSHINPTKSSWASGVAKWFGTLTHRQVNLPAVAQGDDRMYHCTGTCLPEYVGATVSDDAYYHKNRNKVWSAVDVGALTKVTQSRWNKAIAPLNHFVRNGLTDTPACVFATRTKKGTTRTTNYIPTESLHLIEAVAPMFPRLAARGLGDESVCTLFRKQYEQFQAERERYAIWAAGNTADLGLNMRAFDAAVAMLFDCHTKGNLYDRFYDIRIADEGNAPSCPVAPPWRDENGLCVADALAECGTKELAKTPKISDVAGETYRIAEVQ